MSDTLPPMPEPDGWIVDGHPDGLQFRRTPLTVMEGLCHSSAPMFSSSQMHAYAEAYAAAKVAMEREQLLALAKKRADYEVSAAAHHAGNWYVAYEKHITRNAAMRDLIDALQLTSTATAEAIRAG